MNETVAQRLQLPDYPGLGPLDRRVRQWGDLLQMQHEERGEFLKETKKELGHGQWMEFLEQTKQDPDAESLSHAHAKRLMRASDLKGSDLSYSVIAPKVPDINAKLSLYSKSKNIPETAKEAAREEIMNAPEGKTYTEAEVWALINAKTKDLEEVVAFQQAAIKEMEKESGKFDPDRARVLRVEQNGNHLVLGLPSWVASIDEFFKEERYYPEETRYIVREHLISIAHKLSNAGIDAKSVHQPNPFTDK